MPRTQIGGVVTRVGHERTISPAKIRERLADGGSLERLPDHLPGTRLRAALFYTDAAIAGYMETCFAKGQAARRDAFAEILSTVPGRLFSTIARVPSEAKYAYPEIVARRLARNLASAIHLALADAVRPHAGLRPAIAGRALARTVARLEGSYHGLLAKSRRRVADGGRAELLELVQDALPDILGDARKVAAPLARAVMRGGTKADTLSVQFAAVARRLAMLGAALVLVEWRLRQTGATVRAVTRGAREAHQAFRRVRASDSRRSLTGLRVGAQVTIRGRTGTVHFVNRPRKPFSTLTVGQISVRVGHKNILRVGWRAGTAARVRGRVKALGGRRIVEAHFEGLAHGRGVWEDWLAGVARPAYDLYPESIEGEWSLVTARGGLPMSDLLSRTA